MSTKHVDRLEALDRQARGGAASTQLELGHEKVRLGLVAAGLRDMLQAIGRAPDGEDLDDALEALINPGGKRDDTTIASFSDDVTTLARLGEGLRVYARDVQLSRRRDALVDATVSSSIRCFDKALNAPKPEASGDARAETAAAKAHAGKQAWLYAHRGAATMMLYWLALTEATAGQQGAGPTPAAQKELEARFDACLSDFKRSQDLLPGYAWSLQFTAFLYALRGQGPSSANEGPHDFDRAIKYLEDVAKSSNRPASIKRSIAMLASYNAVRRRGDDSGDSERSSAARRSIDEGLDAVSIDQDEFLGAYSVAVSHWALYEMGKAKPDDAERARLRRNTDGAIEAATTRAQNALSQALAALIGLTFVRGRLAHDDDEAAQQSGAAAEGASVALQREVAKYEQLLGMLHSVPLDLETRSMFIRDPAWQAILASPTCKRAFGDGYDQLRQLAYWKSLECSPNADA